MENILEVNNLSKAYDQFQLDDISFNIPKGSIVGLIGENGAGKTTIINAILNLIDIDSGHISIFGKDHIEAEYEIKENLSVVLDDGFFPESLNLKDIQAILSENKSNFSNKAYEELIGKFKLPMDKAISKFSKGMFMKAKIATSLSIQPDLLILDEPTSGLDPIIRDEILEIFLDLLQDENKSILLSSHITSDLDKIADYILFIHEGKKVLFESVIEIKDNYGLLKVSKEDFNQISKNNIIAYKANSFGYQILIKDISKTDYDFDYIIEKPSLEEIMILIIRGERIWKLL